MSDYKLPRCWIGHPVGTRVIAEEDCNPGCHCLHPMQAHFCMEGHMTECHAGMNCEEAECSHYLRDAEDLDEET